MVGGGCWLPGGWLSSSRFQFPIDFHICVRVHVHVCVSVWPSVDSARRAGSMNGGPAKGCLAYTCNYLKCLAKKQLRMVIKYICPSLAVSPEHWSRASMRYILALSKA